MGCLRKCVQTRLDYVIAGCKCKTGCSNRRCKCVRGCKSCGPGCRCISCKNLPNSMNDDKSNIEYPKVGSEGDSEDSSTSDEEDLLIIYCIFLGGGDED